VLIITAEEMREMDRYTIEGIGIPSVVLMENAGVQVVSHLEGLIESEASIVVLTGHGNNGGDGFVVARHLGNKGYDVKTWFVGDMRKCTSESQIHFHSLVHSGYKVKFWDEKNDPELREMLTKADVIIDAMLGIGVTGGLREPLQTIVQFTNQLDSLKIAVDMPTGVNSDNGLIGNTAFLADYTITFSFPKVGQYLYPGADYVGHLIVADISIPPIVPKHFKFKRHLITRDLLKNKLPIRHANSHKGTYGHSLIIGGSVNMPGAPTLATMASLRSGAGLTTVVVPNSIKSMIFSKIPEAICIGAKETDTGNFAINSIDKELLELDKYNSIGIGPGLGIWSDGLNWLKGLLLTTKIPIVVDADGLNLLAEDLDILLKRSGPTILTPHPGEMARLINKDIAYIQQNRIDVARDFAINYKVFVVLKGANSIIATPNGEIYINTTGGPELAKGGSGDVLTGLLTGFLAQELTVKNAILLAVFLHGQAGNLASKPSNYSTVSTDIIERIGDSIQQLMSNSREIL